MPSSAGLPLGWCTSSGKVATPRQVEQRSKAAHRRSIAGSLGVSLLLAEVMIQTATDAMARLPSGLGGGKNVVLLSHRSGAIVIQRRRTDTWHPGDVRALLLGHLSNSNVRIDLLAINTISGAKRLRRVRQANATVEPPAVDALEPARVAGPATP